LPLVAVFIGIAAGRHAEGQAEAVQTLSKNASPHARKVSQKLTGERPRQGVTPDSLLALHDAGYRFVGQHLGQGTLLDIGCGEGFESVRLAGTDRRVVGVDYDPSVAMSARCTFGDRGLRAACMEAESLGLLGRSFDWVCSSHLIEHFEDPRRHVAEMARVLHSDGTAFILTPNAPADFENPFHLRLFRRDDLRSALSESFGEVWVGGLDAAPRVKTDLAARRAKAARLLALDVFDIRHRLPRSWYIGFYKHALPVAYRLLARGDAGGSTGISAEDFFVTDEVDDSTPVLVATARKPHHRDERAQPVADSGSIESEGFTHGGDGGSPDRTGGAG
jgi:SAM-dependent methyltransferase